MIAQKIASNPNNHCWVSASAGTGKTKVLIDRISNLLLSGEDPQSILCLTFTNTASSEMMERLSLILKKWHNDGISKEELFDRGFDESFSDKARSLFFNILRNPVQISTIHGFCLGEIKKIPFHRKDIIDDKKLFDLAKNSVFTEEYRLELEELLSEISESRLSQLLDNYRQFNFNCDEMSILFNHCYPKSKPSICHPESGSNPLPCHPEWSEAEAQDLKAIINYNALELPADNKTHSSATIETLGQLISKELQEKLQSDPFSFFLTQKLEIRKKILPVKYKQFEETFKKAAEQFLNNEIKSRHRKIYKQNVAFKRLADAVSIEYDRIKKYHGFLDYDDLLNINVCDAKIKHLLIDEAQDTSSKQWEVIRALANVVKKNNGTFFVVGDHKQSIYGFQGASPELFADLPDYFEDLFKFDNKDFQRVSLNLCFRACSTILDIVDKTFNRVDNLEFKEMKHYAYRSDSPGILEVWPITKNTKEKTEKGPWDLILEEKEKDNFSKFTQDLEDEVSLIEKNHGIFLSNKILKILSSNIILPSTGEIPKPSDIMVLFQKRTNAIDYLSNFLLEHGIQSTGSDRIILQNNLFVKDLLALGRFLTAHFDDYSLACVLKSPLFNFTEDDLIKACANRESTVFKNLFKLGREEGGKFKYALKKLIGWARDIKEKSPFAFYDRLIDEMVADGIKDPIIPIFLDYVVDYELKFGMDFKGFIENAYKNPKEVKISSSDKSCVRIMTVHASKGLQSPIVILADATEEPGIQKELFLKGMIKPPKHLETIYIENLKKKALNTLKLEHQRLLYVAMTRTKDCLFITGIEKQRGGHGNWYSQIKSCLPEDGRYEIFSFKTMNVVEFNTHYHPDGFSQNDYIDHYNHDSVRNPPLHHPESVPNPPLCHPEWNKAEAQDLKATSKQILSSAPSGLPQDYSLQLPKNKKETAFSEQSAKRGQMIHKALEFLNDFSDDDNPFLNKLDEIDKALVLKIREKYPYVFISNINSSISKEFLIFDDEEFLRVDRIVEFEDEIHIIDFKTHKKQYVYEDIKAQLQKYKEKYREKYEEKKGEKFKQKPIKTFVLWIENAKLEET